MPGRGSNSRGDARAAVRAKSTTNRLTRIGLVLIGPEISGRSDIGGWKDRKGVEGRSGVALATATMATAGESRLARRLPTHPPAQASASDFLVMKLAPSFVPPGTACQSGASTQSARVTDW